jgi:hypothetical protein
VLEFQATKSAERDADILNVANTTAKGVNDIRSMLVHILGLWKKSNGNLLTLGPDAGIGNGTPPTGGHVAIGSSLASALSLVEPYVHTTMTDDFAAKTSRMKVEAVIIRKLKTWLANPARSRLWLYGTNSTTLSAAVFDTARKRHRPAVAYPCRHIGHNGKVVTEQELLVGLVYSLIYQFLQQLPEGTNLDGWTGSPNLPGLDGASDSVPQAVLLLQSLLELLPQSVCIIDGFQLLGHTQDIRIREYLTAFLNLFVGSPGQGNAAASANLGAKCLNL